MNGSAVNILLVEDNPDHAKLVLRNFQNFKIANKITHLDDGELAINYLKIKENKPNLVLLDLRLPKIDGLEVLKFIKTNTELAEIPVVVLTTSEAESDIARAYQFNANSYLVKPVDFARFSELMTTLGYYWICWNKNPYNCA